jgi:REP element-mobilizing transposase RayT
LNLALAVAAVSDRRTSIRDRRYNREPAMKHKPRLSRLKWLYTSSPIYYLTLCTQDRKRTLANDAIYQEMLKFCDTATDFYVWVGLFMIMPDHIHLFAGFAPPSPPLWKWIKSLRGDLSKILREDEGEGTHWEKDFFDHVIRSEESLQEKYEYVRQNPVRAGLVKRPEDWPYQGEIHPLRVL